MFGEKYLVSAEEARALSENSTLIECERELNTVHECIKRAIDRGEYFCWCNHYLYKSAINRLRQLGYTVTNCLTQKDGDLFKIEW